MVRGEPGTEGQRRSQRRKDEIPGSTGSRETGSSWRFSFVDRHHPLCPPNVAQYALPTLASVHRLDTALSLLNGVLQDLFRIFHLPFQ